MRHGLLTRHDRLLRLEKATAERRLELSDEQIQLLERFSPEFRERHIEAPHTGSLVAVDTFFVGVLKGVGKVYLQTAIDCHARRAWARLYTSKLPTTAVHLLNDDVLSVYDAAGTRIETVLSDNGREFCGRPDRHPYELFLQLEGIEHRTTRVKRPQSNGIVERSVYLIEPSVGSVGDAYDNALAESVIGLFKAEVIHRTGPWRGLPAVEFATLEWVDWFNNRRLLEPIGTIPPAEAETRYHAENREPALAA